MGTITHKLSECSDMSEEKKPTEEIKEEKVEVPVTEAKSDEVKAEVQAEVTVTEAKPDEVISEVKAETPEIEKPIEEPRIEGAVNKGDFILMEMTGKAETW